jgi:hypothetical protein
VTRVITFLIGRELSNRTYPAININEAHHGISHHQNQARQIEKLVKINTYHVSLFGYFLDRLKATPDGNGSLLDNSLYLLGSGMGNPDVHDHRQLPILLAGGGGGSLNGGRHIRYNEPTPLANLLLTMLDKAGIEMDKFADSTGKIQELAGEPLAL